MQDARSKIRQGTTKFIFREAMKGILPEVIRTRQDKMGFVNPQEHWIRHELKDAIEAIFASDRFRSRKYFDHRQVMKLFHEHVSGKINISDKIITWLMLELWLETFIDPPTDPDHGLNRADIEH